MEDGATIASENKNNNNFAVDHNGFSFNHTIWQFHFGSKMFMY